MCFWKQKWPETSIWQFNYARLTTLLDPFVMIFNKKKSFMVHYLATGVLLGQKSFLKNGKMIYFSSIPSQYYHKMIQENNEYGKTY